MASYMGQGCRAALLCVCSLLIAATVAEAGDETRGALYPALESVRISARDLKTLHYVENAHGQLEEWSGRLFARLKNELGPREPDPMLDGRADLQVQKIAVTYAGYTETEPLAKVLRELADAEQRRVDAVRTMIHEGPNEADWAAVNAPVQQIVNFIRDWSDTS